MKTKRTAIIIWAFLVTALIFIPASQLNAATARFGSKWQALVGEWKGEDAAGRNAGGCGFHFDLADHILVRTNHAELPGVGGGAAKPHDDLMIVYPESSEDKAKAIYFDNEGHTIEYDAEWSADSNTLTFLSKPGAGPQFRLTYQKVDEKAFSVVFAMAAPGQTSFKVYTSGRIKRE